MLYMHNNNNNNNNNNINTWDNVHVAVIMTQVISRVHNYIIRRIYITLKKVKEGHAPKGPIIGDTTGLIYYLTLSLWRINVRIIGAYFRF